MVGFVDVTTELINRLTTETNYLDIISIIGMFGLGKTTLAWKIYNDPNILFQFPIRIWLSISQQFSNKDIFLAILDKFTTLTDELRSKNEQDLIQMVGKHLDTGKFLIVMDDVWDKDDWNRLREVLPTKNNKGKVMITSRKEDVGKCASLPREPKRLRFFTNEESLELLRLEALGQQEFPADLDSVGQLIAKDCGGLPLAIVVIGGILATKYSASDIGEMKRAWEEVSTRVNIHYHVDAGDRMHKFISLSYDTLPHYLRACFLYLGMFPEDYEIPVSKLLRMWIGEGFIQHKKDYSLEETALNYLEDLINRNLVRIDKIKPDGKAKTCRIHDTLRDFCITEAGKENFLEEVKYKDRVFAPPISNICKYRRLTIHSNCVNFLSSKLPDSHGVRSFVCIPKDEYTLPQANCPAIPAAFKMLRILDVKPVRFTKITSDMFHLVHLRFITLSFNSHILPPKFSKLWNIQTLIVDTTQRNLQVKADIWKMKQLRHFKTNVAAILPKPDRDSEHGVELQTLGTISVESCSAELLHQASNLKKLGISGQLALFFEGKIGSFESLVKMRNLEKLELTNDVYPHLPSEGQLYVLPQPYQFPSSLRILTLCATFLEWSYMSTLGLLENLQALKLKDKAFMGKTWEGVDGRFRSLEFLHIDHTDLVVWKATEHHFPRLKGLVLRNCEGLGGIPPALAGISSFKKLDLYICKPAAASAKEIAGKKGGTFKLSIFPAND